MSYPVRLGIIGCGAIAQEHARSLASLDGASLRAYCDQDESRGAHFLKSFGGTYASADPHRILADDAIDAVYICTHADSHAGLGIAAARAGKHVFMEKPLALTERECYDLAWAVEKSGVTMMTGFKLRFYPAVRVAREFISSPTLVVGEMMDVHWLSEFWGNDPLRGGGNVLSQGCHSVDLLYYMIGAEPVTVFAEGGNFHHPDNRIVDTLVATIQFANGTIGSLVQGDSGHVPHLSKFSFQAMDGKRTAHLHNRLLSATLWDGEREIRHEDRTETGILEENRAFLEALREQREPPVGVRDGLRATILLLRALDSIATNTPQTIRS
jgi:predicted dehydrogenase